MKLVLYQNKPRNPILPGILTNNTIISLENEVTLGNTPQQTMTNIIDNYEKYQPRLQELANIGKALPLSKCRLYPPLLRPRKILACIGNYWEHAQREPRELNMFLKSPDAVIGPEDTIVLPDFTEPWIFMHEAELALVIKGPAKNVKAEDWKTAVFGYTCARADIAQKMGIPIKRFLSHIEKLLKLQFIKYEEQCFKYFLTSRGENVLKCTSSEGYDVGETPFILTRP